jgi:DNA-directed RNA polymerase alpha subunit
MTTKKLALTLRQMEKTLKAARFLAKGESLFAQGEEKFVFTVTKGQYTQEQKTYLEQSIDDLDFSVRLLNLLNGRKIETLSALFSIPPIEIRKWRGWNERCTDELNTALAEKGIPPYM